MELVVLFPPRVLSLLPKCPLLRLTESDKYEQISEKEIVEEQFSQMKINDDEKLYPGIIVTGSNLISIKRNLLNTIDEMLGFENAFYIFTAFTNSPSILQINESEYIWFESFLENDFEKSNGLIVPDFQMLLFETDVPLTVSKELNVVVSTSNEMIVRVFRSVDDEPIKYFARFLSVSIFEGIIKNLLNDNKKSASFNVLLENGKFSSSLSLSGTVDTISQIKLKYSTVILYETSKKQLKNSSAEILEHPAYKAAFYSRLKGKIVSDLIRLSICIRDINTNIEAKKIYSPVISICQSSGSGKSKLACSLNEKYPCAYLVLRKDGENSFPEQSRLGNLFQQCSIPSANSNFASKLNETNIGRYSALFWAIASDYLSLLKELKEKKPDLTGMQIRSHILNEFIAGNVFGAELQKIESNQDLAISEYSFEKYQAEMTRISNLICQELNLNPQVSPFIIVIDEANLLSYPEYNKDSGQVPRSRLLRRAMHSLGTKSNVVFLTLGTKTDYIDLNPVVSSDSIRDSGRFNLYPPFILSRNTDIFNDEIVKKKVNSKMLKDPRFILVRFAMGRPIWQSLGLSQVVRMARIKLENSSDETGQVFVACWMIRTGIAANPRMVEVSRHMVKSNMATLLNIHPELPIMNICYPSEPVLAMASQEIVSSDLVKYFNILRNYLICAAFDRGDLAETLAADICIQAMYKAEPIELEASGSCLDLNDLPFINSQKFMLESQLDAQTLEEKTKQFKVPNECIELVSKSYLHHTTVEEFLKVLFKDNYKDLISNIDTRILKGIVSFNHFIRLNRAPKDFKIEEVDEDWECTDMEEIISRDLIQLGLKRGAAFLMPSSYPGINLLIPVCLEDEQPVRKFKTGKKGKDTNPTNQDSKVEPSSKFFMISIQVKAGNLDTKTKRDEAVKNLYLAKKLVKCNSKPNCEGCSRCEKAEDLEFIRLNQLALVFAFGKKSQATSEKTPLAFKRVYNTLTELHYSKDKKDEGSKDKKDEKVKEKVTVIFNNDLSFLKHLWGEQYAQVKEIFESILQFSWLPHNYIDSNLPTAAYYNNEILENYLDKPLILEMSNIFRSQFGWKELVNPNENEENCKKLIHDMKISKII